MSDLWCCPFTSKVRVQSHEWHHRGRVTSRKSMVEKLPINKWKGRGSLCLKAQKQHMYRQVLWNYVGAIFSVTQKTDSATNKRCNVQLSATADKDGSHTELETLFSRELEKSDVWGVMKLISIQLSFIRDAINSRAKARIYRLTPRPRKSQLGWIKPQNAATQETLEVLRNVQILPGILVGGWD